MISHMSLSDRVRCGVEWLDQNYPGWESKVNLQTLNMYSAFECVFGQVVNRSWLFAFEMLGQNLDDECGPAAHGFNYTIGSDHDYEMLVLERMWRYVVSKRLRQKAMEQHPSYTS